MGIGFVKKINLAIGGIPSLIVFALYLMESPLEAICLRGGSWCYALNNALGAFGGTWAFLLVPFFIFSVITYFVRKEVFVPWAYFAIPWTILTVASTYLSPDDGGGGFMIRFSSQAFVALIMSALFVIISTLIIGVAYLRSRRLNNY